MGALMERPIEGQINWNADHMPTPLNYARYVDSVERVAESIELDDVLFVPVVRCVDCKHAFKVTWPNHSKVPPDYLDCHGELVETWDYYADEPKYNPVSPDGYCAWAERKGDAE